MVKHEFLGLYRRQRVVYSDSTVVTIDLDKDTYKIEQFKNWENMGIVVYDFV